MEQMTPKEAKSILNCMAIDMTGALGGLKKSNPMTDVIEQRLNAIDVAISALEKQVPKKPIIDKLDLSNQGIDWLKYSCLCLCPACNNPIADFDNETEYFSKFPYCKHCGQAIDWSK